MISEFRNESKKEITRSIIKDTKGGLLARESTDDSSIISTEGEMDRLRCNRISQYSALSLLYSQAGTANLFPGFHTHEAGQDHKIMGMFPAYNEEVAIGSMVLHTGKYVDHIIVIDDGSTDRTSEVARLAGAKVKRHLTNKGKGAAPKTSFLEVSKEGTEVLVTMDTDGQHDPSDIPALIAPILAKEADMVKGSRHMNGNGKNIPFYRRIWQNILDRATDFNSGPPITDMQSGFRAFARHTLKVFRFRSNGLEIESEMLMDAAKAGLRLKEVEIGVRYDVDGSSENPVSHGLGVLMKLPTAELWGIS